MTWETQGSRSYYYRSVRRGKKVRRAYYGTGAVGRLAAEAAARHRAERQLAAAAWAARKRDLAAAAALTQQLQEACTLLASATLLTAGFHRPTRHSWRMWRHAQRILARTCQAGRQGRTG